MRICILTHTFPRFENDPTAPFMDGVANAIAGAGNQVFVLTPYTPELKNPTLSRGYSVVTYRYIFSDKLHQLGYSQTLANDMKLKTIVWLLAPFMYLFGTLALIRLIKKEKIEVVNAHWILPNGFMACVAKIFTGVVVVSTLPGSDVYMAQKNFFFSLLAKFATKHSDWVTSNSPQLLNDLARIYSRNSNVQKALRQKFSSVIYGVNPDKFRPMSDKGYDLKQKLNISNNEFIVLGVGRLVAKKGFRYLVKAAADVLKVRKNVTFIIIGGGDQEQELIKLTEKLNISAKFRFLGWVDYSELVHYYNMCDIFALPSVRDKKGNLDDQSVSVIEAISCGKPVITADFPGYRLVVKNNVNGVLVNAKDYQQISKVIIQLISSKTTRTKMGKMGRKMVLSLFSWKAIGKKYTDLFKKLLF